VDLPSRHDVGPTMAENAWVISRPLGDDILRLAEAPGLRKEREFAFEWRTI
jgi:hypothetical protein